MDRFDQHGYPSTAPGWPGIAETVEATRANPNDIANRGLEEVTDRYRQLISGMERLPIVVGHSFGALIAEKLLEEEQAVAAITIDAAAGEGRAPRAARAAALDACRCSGTRPAGTSRSR